MLLDGGLYGVLLQELHGLAAAVQVTGTTLYYFYNGSAYGALVNFCFLCHIFGFLRVRICLTNNRSGRMVQREARNCQKATAAAAATLSEST